MLSESLVGRFTMVPAHEGSGTLFLDRRCDVHSCHGHCTCAPHGHLLCDDWQDCTDVTGTGDTSLLVLNFWSLALYVIVLEWFEQASQWHEMYCHDLEVMGSNPGRVELVVHSTSVLSHTWTTNITMKTEKIWFLGIWQNLSDLNCWSFIIVSMYYTSTSLTLLDFVFAMVISGVISLNPKSIHTSTSSVNVWLAGPLPSSFFPLFASCWSCLLFEGSAGT